jgi:hypothetical protein
MFANLMNLGFERSAKQGIGFYLAYLFVGILLGALVGAISAVITGDGSFEAGVRIGNITAIIMCLLLAGLIAHKKGMFRSFSSLLLIIASGLFAVLLGGVGGLMPVAYLSTRPNAHNQSNKAQPPAAGTH